MTTTPKLVWPPKHEAHGVLESTPARAPSDPKDSNNLGGYDEADIAPDFVPDEPKDCTMEPKPVDDKIKELALKPDLVKTVKKQLKAERNGYSPYTYIKKGPDYCIRAEMNCGRKFDVHFKYLAETFSKVKAKWINCKLEGRMQL